MRWVGLAMEYMPGGNLFDLITDDEVLNLPILLRHQFCKDIADGIRFLHGNHDGKRMIHGDLKLENILLTRNLVCKIADLGSAAISTITGLSSISTNAHSTGHTPMYAAPEMMGSSFSRGSKSSDMFSFGVIIELILSRSSVRTPPDALEGMLNELKEEQDQRSCSIIDSLGSMVTNLCRVDPDERLTITAAQAQLNSADVPSPDEVSACVADVLKSYAILDVDSSEDFDKPLECISMPTIQGRGMLRSMLTFFHISYCSYSGMIYPSCHIFNKFQ